MIAKAVALIDFVWMEQYKRFTLTPGKGFSSESFDRVSAPVLNRI